MAHIKTVSPARAKGATKEAYRYLKKTGRYLKVPNIFKVLSLRSDTLYRIIRKFELSLWVTPEPRTMIEMTSAAVSHLNNCHY